MNDNTLANLDTINSQKKLGWIQALRGIASILVVFGHAHYFLKGTASWDFAVAILRPGGFIGVDLFFLISGFVMIYTTQNSDGSFKYILEFWAKRIVRIAPVYMVLTFFYISIWKDSSWLLSPTNWYYILKSFLYLPISTNAPFFGLPNPVGWSLNYEIYFYLIFGFTLLTRRFKILALFIVIFLSTYILPLITKGVVSFDANYSYQFSIKYLNIVTSSLVWTFFAGALSGYLYLNLPSIKNQFILKNLMWLSIGMAIWWSYSGTSSFHGLNNVGLPLFFAFTIFAIASKSFEIKVPNWLQWLGNISFSLYLVHPIAQGMMTRFANEIMHKPELENTWSQVIASTILSLVFASLSHKYLEVKLCSALRRNLARFIPK